MKGCGWAAAGGVWLWCIIWFIVVEVFKVAMNFALREGVDNLFMADFGDVEEEKRELSMHEGRTSSRYKHALEAASSEIKDEESLPKISVPMLIDPAVAAVLEALQRHVVSLERRVKELDGRNINLEKIVRTLHPREATTIEGIDESKESGSL